MKARFAITFGLLVCVLTAAPAVADDLLPPDWRGANNSTLQVWEFSTDVNPVPPDLIYNPFGPALATIFGEFQYPLMDTYWLAEDHGHVGVWNVGGAILLEIPNDPQPRPLKLIRLQVTYDSTPPPELAPWIDVIPAGDAVVTGFQLVQRVILDDWYVHDTYDIVVEPNPLWEEIWLQPRYCGLRVDQIVLDTVCVPEPSSLGSLAAVCVIGVVACALRLRRRRR